MAASGPLPEQEMSSGAPHTGGCACGAVRFELTAEPDRQLYCHCSDCQIHHAAPIRQSIIYTNQDEPVLRLAEGDTSVAPVLRFIKGCESLTRHNHTAANNRFFCKHCGTSIFNYSPVRRTISVPPINVQSFFFKPQMHIYCTHAPRGSLVALINDGLPKYKDRPKDQGGSGECI